MIESLEQIPIKECPVENQHIDYEINQGASPIAWAKNKKLI